MLSISINSAVQAIPRHLIGGSEKALYRDTTRYLLIKTSLDIKRSIKRQTMHHFLPRNMSKSNPPDFALSVVVADKQIKYEREI